MVKGVKKGENSEGKRRKRRGQNRCPGERKADPIMIRGFGLSTRNSKLETRNFFYKFGLNRLSLSELLTTDTELMAIAAEAIIGFRRIPQKG